VFAFLGRNGSGKTTTIRMLLGLLQPTRGEAAILGNDIRALPPSVRARIGYLTEEHQLYSWMSVKECGEFQSRFYPRWDDKTFRGVTGHFALKPGDYAQINFVLPSRANTLLVPSSALMFRDNGMSVATVGPDGRVTLKSITVGRDLGSSVEVSAGLSHSDRIVNNPPDFIGQGTLVHIASSRAIPGPVQITAKDR